jgi:hypothetical protein
MDISLAYRCQPAPSPQERDRICQLISRALALEELSRTNAKREVWARISIGLRPIPRPLHGERCQ